MSKRQYNILGRHIRGVDYPEVVLDEDMSNRSGLMAQKVTLAY